MFCLVCWIRNHGPQGILYTKRASASVWLILGGFWPLPPKHQKKEQAVTKYFYLVTHTVYLQPGSTTIKTFSCCTSSFNIYLDLFEVEFLFNTTKERKEVVFGGSHQHCCLGWVFLLSNRQEQFVQETSWENLCVSVKVTRYETSLSYWKTNRNPLPPRLGLLLPHSSAVNTRYLDLPHGVSKPSSKAPPEAIDTNFVSFSVLKF